MTKKAGNGFEAMGLSETMLAAIKKAGFEEPSPIQAALVPVAMSGVDCIGQAHTGTGKTAAFMIPILEELDFKTKRPLALIMVPTRELSEQVAEEGRKLAVNRKDVAVVSIVGGKSMHDQTVLLKKGAQILVGTPGRVLDMLGRGHFDPQTLEFVVLDEADRMLDIGFRPDIEKILKRCPNERQTLLLSATLPPPVERLAKRYMYEPQMIDLSKDEVSSHGIKQYYVTVDQDRKLQTLVRLLAQERPEQALVFTRTKRGADLLHAKFKKRLSSVATLHGDLPQTKRDKVMQRFRSGETRLLIATDVVGRGIDIRGISHIINYDIPEFCDDYVHRIGRAGRMSSSSTGSAFTFVTREQGGQLTSIELRINKLIEPYTIKDFEPARSVKKIQHVSEMKQPPRSFG
jgi:ATP-dependent RNA helicase DeaD